MPITTSGSQISTSKFFALDYTLDVVNGIFLKTFLTSLLQSLAELHAAKVASRERPRRGLQREKCV